MGLEELDPYAVGSDVADAARKKADAARAGLSLVTSDPTGAAQRAAGYLFPDVHAGVDAGASIFAAGKKFGEGLVGSPRDPSSSATAQEAPQESAPTTAPVPAIHPAPAAVPQEWPDVTGGGSRAVVQTNIKPPTDEPAGLLDEIGPGINVSAYRASPDDAKMWIADHRGVDVPSSDPAKRLASGMTFSPQAHGTSASGPGSLDEMGPPQAMADDPGARSTEIGGAPVGDSGAMRPGSSRQYSFSGSGSQGDLEQQGRAARAAAELEQFRLGPYGKEQKQADLQLRNELETGGQRGDIEMALGKQHFEQGIGLEEAKAKSETSREEARRAAFDFDTKPLLEEYSKARDAISRLNLPPEDKSKRLAEAETRFTTAYQAIKDKHGIGDRATAAEYYKTHQ